MTIQQDILSPYISTTVVATHKYNLFKYVRFSTKFPICRPGVDARVAEWWFSKASFSIIKVQPYTSQFQASWFWWKVNSPEIEIWEFFRVPYNLKSWLGPVWLSLKLWIRVLDYLQSGHLRFLDLCVFGCQNWSIEQL